MTEGDYVVCPHTITSPAADPEEHGFQPNEPCAARCSVVTEAPLMEFTCWRGHRFIAKPEDIVRDSALNQEQQPR